jgi:hypothetical protein
MWMEGSGAGSRSKSGSVQIITDSDLEHCSVPVELIFVLLYPPGSIFQRGKIIQTQHLGYPGESFHQGICGSNIMYSIVALKVMSENSLIST